MTRAAFVLAVLLLACPPAAAAAEVMVVGRGDKVLEPPRTVALKARTLKVGGRTCTTGPRTPLTLLVATRLPLRARDLGSCGSARDAGAIYVFSVAGQSERGRGGWVYKVGRRVGTAGAGDPNGPFGTGRGLRASDRVLWFWCELRPSGGCQRTLEVRPAARTVAPGASLRVTVRAYDDRGRGVPAPGATVRLRGASAVADAGGVATLAVPATRGRASLSADAAGAVRAFPVRVTVR